jgi:hypothetical protein
MEMEQWKVAIGKATEVLGEIEIIQKSRGQNIK